ncbi:MAG: DMT family transporter [Acidobacteriota bacterium]
MTRGSWHAWPALRGGLLAFGAALLFGISTPLVQLAGQGTGPFLTAALLYGGAAGVSVWLRRPVEREARLARGDAPRLLAMAVAGAAVGPVALAWGLQHTSGTAASLMLTLEAVFTAVLAWALYGESMDRRVIMALLLLTAGGMALVWDGGAWGGTQVWGLLAVMLATLAWGIDNTLSRALADRDPAQVVMGKALIGAMLTLLMGPVMGEARPSWGDAAALVAIGATGYGLSLRLYLLAQRAIGAGRTGSVFAFAPFMGAALAAVLHGGSVSAGSVWAGGLMLAGVMLHLAESHAHWHEHAALEHEHAHRHDDGHHDHVHDPMPVGVHSHRHRHQAIGHSHPHAPDLHHTHSH